MVGELTEPEIESILRTQAIGHLACSNDEKLYLVPITYYFEDGAIYSYTNEGAKTHIMQENPKVCFQVEEIANEHSWRSVIAWGRYEELPKSKQEEVMTRLQHWAEDALSKGIKAYLPFESQARLEHALQEKELPIVYRIVITEKTGRFEHNTSED
jgi:nitroimidazol reductase NimA-like FMN-containing flavoprotein (pyridoxamine 5'-phosphate oxidase superfamily)